MSLALLKRKPSHASADLQTTDDTLQMKKQGKQMIAPLGAERHDIKEKTRKRKEKHLQCWPS
jgi:hypothetical protein